MISDPHITFFINFHHQSILPRLRETLSLSLDILSLSIFWSAVALRSMLSCRSRTRLEHGDFFGFLLGIELFHVNFLCFKRDRDKKNLLLFVGLLVSSYLIAIHHINSAALLPQKKNQLHYRSTSSNQPCTYACIFCFRLGGMHDLDSRRRSVSCIYANSCRRSSTPCCPRSVSRMQVLDCRAALCE